MDQAPVAAVCLYLCVYVCLLVGDEDLPSTDDLRQWNALVFLPLLNSFRRVDEDDEVVSLALVVDFGLGIVSTHVGCLFDLENEVGIGMKLRKRLAEECGTGIKDTVCVVGLQVRTAASRASCK